MKKGLSLALLIILIHLHLSKAIVKDCASEDCLIGYDLESEFSLSSHAARMLYDVSTSKAGKTGNKNGAAVNCRQSKGYRSCLPSRNGGGPNQRCGTFTRTC
ncbi:hypothetical protein SESBI_44689 [Sesbania bispinosa]|nr:hypothetical protein SESBI_44689 [Sesbania bispinosa]